MNSEREVEGALAMLSWCKRLSAMVKGECSICSNNKVKETLITLLESIIMFDLCLALTLIYPLGSIILCSVLFLFSADDQLE